MSEAVARLRRWWQRLRWRVPAGQQAGMPGAAGWSIAIGLAVGAAATAGLRSALVVLALVTAGLQAFALRRDPVPRWAAPHLALLVAASLLAGAAREATLSAAPVAHGPVRGLEVELLESLGPDGGAIRGRLPARAGGQTVLLRVGQFAEAEARDLNASAGTTMVVERGALEELDPRHGADAGYIEHLRRQRVAARLRVDQARVVGRRGGGVLLAIDDLGVAAEERLRRLLGDRRGTLVAGMALGRADGIDDDDAEVLRTSGLWHLVAASGGNIALVVALVMAIGWLAGIPDRARLLCAAVAVASYVPLAGGGPSIQRAGVMGLIGLAAWWRGDEHRGRDALAAAAAATLLLDPGTWRDVGWQLSFAAAGALIVTAPWVVARSIAAGVPRALAVVGACSVVATIATAPILLLTFGEVSLVGLATNVVVAPLVGIVVWGGVLTLLLGPAAVLVAVPCGWTADVILAVAEWGAARQLAVLTPRQVGLTVVALALLITLRLPRRWMLRVSAVGLLGAFVITPGAPRDPRLVVLDVGQGSAALLQHGRDGILFDTGPRRAGVVRALRRTGVRRLRAVILSHPAADHDGGTAAVINAFPTEMLLDGGSPGGGRDHADGLAAAREHRVPVRPLRAGQRLRVGALDVRVLWPTPAAARAAGDPNDRSGVLHATVGGWRALIPGDAEGNVLRRLPARDLASDVFVLGHHGSRDDDLATVLRHAKPRVGVISVGAGNRYGHPAPETLSSLQAAKIPVLRTDQAGTIAISAAGGRLRVTTDPPR